MPPKKKTDEGTDPNAIAGCDGRETKMLAAAYVASIAPDKFNYDLFSELAGFTAGSLKKLFPPVKRKMIEAHPSFATFLGTPVNTETKEKPAAGKKRKAASDGDENETAKATSPVKKAKAAPKKRKATPGSDNADTVKEPTPEDVKAEDTDAEKPVDKKDTKKADVKKKAPARARGRPKKAKKEESPEAADDGDDDKDKDADVKGEEDGEEEGENEI